MPSRSVVQQGADTIAVVALVATEVGVLAGYGPFGGHVFIGNVNGNISSVGKVLGTVKAGPHVASADS